MRVGSIWKSIVMHPVLKRICSRQAALILVLSLWRAGGGLAWAQTPATNQVWIYRLLNDSYLLDDCPICDRISLPEPLRGTFSLRLLEQNPLFSSYAVEGIDFRAGSPRTYTVKGSGTLRIGGEVALLLQMSLQTEIDDGFTNKLCYFTNLTRTVDRPWPMLDVTLVQTNGTLAQVFTLRLAAAPLREIWLSTARGFTPTTGESLSTSVFGGDLISSSGRVV